MLRRLRIEEGWFTLLLTWSLVLIAALAIVDAELIQGTSILPSIATLSVLTGLLLAKSSFSGRTALFFALVSSRYERRSMIVTSNKPFGRWGEVFGDPVAVAAMVDRLVHHAEIIVLKGDSYRLRGKGEEVFTGSKER